MYSIHNSTNTRTRSIFPFLFFDRTLHFCSNRFVVNVFSRETKSSYSDCPSLSVASSSTDTPNKTRQLDHYIQTQTHLLVAAFNTTEMKNPITFKIPLSLFTSFFYVPRPSSFFKPAPCSVSLSDRKSLSIFSPIHNMKPK